MDILCEHHFHDRSHCVSLLSLSKWVLFVLVFLVRTYSEQSVWSLCVCCSIHLRANRVVISFRFHMIIILYWRGALPLIVFCQNCIYLCEMLVQAMWLTDSTLIDLHHCRPQVSVWVSVWLYVYRGVLVFLDHSTWFSILGASRLPFPLSSHQAHCTASLHTAVLCLLHHIIIDNPSLKLTSAQSGNRPSAICMHTYQSPQVHPQIGSPRLTHHILGHTQGHSRTILSLPAVHSSSDS